MHEDKGVCWMSPCLPNLHKTGGSTLPTRNRGTMELPAQPLGWGGCHQTENRLMIFGLSSGRSPSCRLASTLAYDLCSTARVFYSLRWGKIISALRLKT